MRCGADGRTGVYGWRKRCLYAVLLLLLVLALGNLGATLLLINTIHFNFDGLGDLAITVGGVELREGGVSYVYDSLVTPRLSSRPGRPLSFAGYKNLSAVLRDPAGHPMQSLEFYSTPFDSSENVDDHGTGHSVDLTLPRCGLNRSLHPFPHTDRTAVSASASRFSIADLRGRTLFAATPDSVTVGTDILKVVEGGVHFSGSVQTAAVRSSPASSELLLESATRRLRLTSPGYVSLESRKSNLSASCLADLQLISAAGRIKMEAPGVYIPHLENFKIISGHSSRPWAYVDQSTPPKSYQICMCGNGKLFVSRPDGDCVVDNDKLQCR